MQPGEKTGPVVTLTCALAVHFACVLLSLRVTCNDANKIMRNSYHPSLSPIRLLSLSSSLFMRQSHVSRNEVVETRLINAARVGPMGRRCQLCSGVVVVLLARSSGRAFICSNLQRIKAPPETRSRSCVRAMVDDDEISASHD